MKFGTAADAATSSVKDELSQLGLALNDVDAKLKALQAKNTSNDQLPAVVNTAGAPKK
jgi:hypothetical protein